MLQSSFYNVINWKKCDVDNWVKGLDPSLNVYFPLKDVEYDGKWLMNLTLHDLKAAGIQKVGHCMLILDAVKTLFDEMHFSVNDNLQNAIFKVNCDATLLINMMDKLLRLNESLQLFLDKRVSPFYKTLEEAYQSDELYPGQLDEIQNIKMAIISIVLKLMKSVRIAVSWMNKPSFLNFSELRDMKSGLIEELKRVNYFSQMIVSEKKEQHLADIKGIAHLIKYRTEIFFERCKDSLYLTPCVIENVLIHKAESMVFGINVKTLGNNLHIIESIDNNTPAYNVGKLEEGDEILEINGQVIVGWLHHRVIEELRSHYQKLCLRLRKRPMHVNESLSAGNRRKMNNRRGLSPAGCAGNSESGGSASFIGIGGGGGGSAMIVRRGVLSRPSRRLPSNANVAAAVSGASPSSSNLTATTAEVNVAEMLVDPYISNTCNIITGSVSSPSTPILLPKSGFKRESQTEVKPEFSSNDKSKNGCHSNRSNKESNRELSISSVTTSTEFTKDMSDSSDAVTSDRVRSLSLNNSINSSSPNVATDDGVDVPIQNDDDDDNDDEDADGDDTDKRLVKEMFRKLSISDKKYMVFPDIKNMPKIEDPGSEGEYSAVDNSPYIGRHRIKDNSVGTDSLNYDSDIISPQMPKRSNVTRLTSEDEDFQETIGSLTDCDSPVRKSARDMSAEDIRKLLLKKLDPRN